MNQQSLTAKARDNFRKMIRKKELEKRFEEHRRTWQMEQKKYEEQEFYRIYPNINDDNYGEHIQFILEHACNDSYNFMLVPLMGYTYEDMLRNPETEENYLILEVMTQFEEIEIPQTEHFAALLMNALPKRCKVILNIITNLLENRRYSQMLRDLLLEFNFLREAEAIFQNLLENGADSESMRSYAYLYFCICCQFIKSHPVVEHTSFEVIAKTLAGMISGEEEKFQLFQTLNNISYSHKPSDATASLLFNLFHKLAINEYFKYVEEITQFLIYCIRSEVQIDYDFKQLLLGSLEHHNEEVRKKALHFFQIAIGKTEEFQKRKLYEELNEGYFVTRISNLFISSSLEMQNQCMECFGLLARQIASDLTDSTNANNFIRIILTALQSSEIAFIIKALKVLLAAVQAVQEEEPESSHICSSIEMYNLRGKLHELNSFNREISKIVEEIESCLATLPVMH